MGEPDENKAFIPFNFSSVLPFDAISNALRELPTPQHVEPAGPFSHLPHLPTDAPSHEELTEMTRLVSLTARDDEWSRDAISDVQRVARYPDDRKSVAWLNSHSQEASSALQRNFKRAPSSTPLPPPRPTPKRPRPRPSQELIDVDTSRSTVQEASQSGHRAASRRHHPSRVPPSPQSEHHVQADPEPTQIVHSHQSAPRGTTAPLRATAAPHGTMAPQEIAPQQRSNTRNLSHAQELRRHEDARDVESEDFEKFLKQLQSFSERPDALISTTYDADEPPALLATGNIGVVTDLRQAIALVAPSGAMKHADPGLLAKVIVILQARVRSCARQCHEASSSSAVKLSSRDASLGVLAVCTVLDILAAPESPRSLLVEELLDDIILLLRAVMTLVVFPMCDPQFKNLKTNNRKKRKQNRSTRRAADDVTVPSDEDDREDDFSPKTGKVRRGALLKKDEDLLTHCRLFLDGLTALFEKEKFLPDSVISQCSSVCIQSLSVIGIPRLQSHAVRTICMIFSSYSSHRLSIMDEVREIAGSLPEAKRHLRPFQLSEGTVSVRTSSALLGLLLCVASHDIRESPLPKQINSLSQDMTKEWCDEREMSHKRAVKFAMHILKPLFTRVSQERDQDFKLAFQTFFEDLLVLFGRPEWPSAELLLQSLSVSIITKMRSGSEKSAHARGVAIDTLGSLAARMAALYGKRLVQDQDSSLDFTGVNKTVEEARETVLLYFEPERSLHFASVESFYEAMFVSDDYSLANNITRRTKAMASQRNATDKQEDEDVIDGEDGERLDKDAVVAAIERAALKRAESIRIRRARGEKVSKEEATKATHFISLNRNFVGGFKTILGAIFDGLQDSAPSIRARSIKALSSMDEACPGILRAFPNIMKDVGPSCRDISTLVRDAALDLISRSLLAGLKDVKDKGSTEPELDDEDFSSSVFDVVLKRLWDSAVSVRKRAIGIMKAVLANSLEHCRAALEAPASAVQIFRTAELHKERIIRICTSLVSRLEDPESTVKEAAERALRFGLFGFDISQALPAKNDHLDIAPQLAERLIGVFSKLPSNIHLSFISRVAHKAILIKQGPLLHAIVNSAVEQFHSFEERITTISNGVNPNDLTNGERKEVALLSSRRVACTSLISAFGSLDASLIENHCRSLAPSIKGVIEANLSENDLITVQRILNVLEIGIGQSSLVDPAFLNEILCDVELIVSHSPIAILEEASVRCLCVVASKIGHTQPSSDAVFRLTSTFKTFLDTRIGEEFVELLQSKRNREESAARCALVRLGLLAKYGDLDQESVEEVFKTLQAVGDIVCKYDSKGLLSRALVRALSHFLIKQRGFLPVGTARLVSMLSSRVVMNGSNPEKSDSMLSSRGDAKSADHGVKLCVFQGFHELLRDEEDRNTNKDPEGDADANGRRDAPDVPKNGKSESKSKDVVLAAEEDAEAGFLALSAQAMVPSLKDAVQSSSVHIRRVVANILGLLVRQGLLLPATIVSSLFTLSLDTDTHCRDYAFRVVNFIADRHSGMLASAAVPALRVCFKTAFELHAPPQTHPNQEGAVRAADGSQNRLNLSSLTAVCIDPKTGHALLSTAIMALRREQRKGVLENLMKEFDPRVVVVVRKRVSHMNEGSENEKAENQIRETNGDTDVLRRAPSTGATADDDDVAEIGDKDIDLEGGTGRCELAALHFFAMTLACMDYTNGAGIGGSLSHGGGTAAADLKMKYAREEVNELVSTATRIISNSGQAVLRVAKHICRGEVDKTAKGRIALFAARICVLLSLKYHLKVERWKGSEDDMRGVDDGNSGVVRMPTFRPDCELVESVGWSHSTAAIAEDVADRQIERLVRMMREDAIDEADLTVPSRRGGRSTGKGKGRPSTRRRKMVVEDDGQMVTPVTQLQRRRATRRVSTSKRLTYEDGSDDDGSDYNPGGS